MLMMEIANLGNVTLDISGAVLANSLSISICIYIYVFPNDMKSSEARKARSM